jgi:OHCU decarboxylase
LAGRLAQLGELTAASAREQASAGLNEMTAAELERFQAFNAAYRAKFGFPFVICARLNDRSTIARALADRLQQSAEAERRTALAEIEKIAWLRLQDVLK